VGLEWTYSGLKVDLIVWGGGVMGDYRGMKLIKVLAFCNSPFTACSISLKIVSKALSSPSFLKDAKIANIFVAGSSDCGKN
jgi:hypothetical protein